MALVSIQQANTRIKMKNVYNYKQKIKICYN